MPTVSAQQVATGLTRPVFATSPPGDHGRLFIVEQRDDAGTGRIKILQLNSGTINPTPFLEIPNLSTGDEQGLLGLAFHPDFQRNRQFFVHFVTGKNTDPEPKFQIHVKRFEVSANPDVVAAGSAPTVIDIPHPRFGNHNGGWLAFGPRDGFLYISLGDGGNHDDVDEQNHPRKNAQNLGVLLGKLLRIDVNGDDFPGDPNRNYAIPPNNPFVNRPGASPEIWAFGLRNPWRCSFDRQTGDLYIGDVGQDKVEEIDFQPATSSGGENYGWRIREGNLPGPGANDPHGTQPLTDPIHVYDHSEGQAVIGGYVYRGSQISGLQGTYFFADHFGAVHSFRFDGHNPPPNPDDRMAELFPGGGSGGITSFAEDAAGEMYIVKRSSAVPPAADGSVLRISSP